MNLHRNPQLPKQESKNYDQAYPRPECALVWQLEAEWVTVTWRLEKWLLPYFYFLQCHTLKLYSVVITVPFSQKKKYYKSSFAKKKNPSTCFICEKNGGGHTVKLSLVLSWFSALSVHNNKHTRSGFLSPSPRQLLSGAIISPNLWMIVMFCKYRALFSCFHSLLAWVYMWSAYVWTETSLSYCASDIII